MEDVQCTQKDLVEVMQKLLSERKKVKNLEEEMQKLKNGYASDLPSNQNIATPLSVLTTTKEDDTTLSQKEHEVQLLKKIVQELGAKLKSTEETYKDELKIKQEELNLLKQKEQISPPAPKETLFQPNTHEIHDIKQINFQLQNELSRLRERIHTQEEEITRLQQFRQAELNKYKEQQNKTIVIEEEKGVLVKEIERLKEDILRERTSHKKNQEADAEIARYKTDIEKLQSMILQLSQKEAHVPKELSTIQQEALKIELEEAKKKTAHLELELEDHKLLLRDLSSKYKESEVKQHTLLQQKEDALTKLLDTIQQLKQKELLYKEVIREKETLLKTCKELEQKHLKELEENRLLEQDLHDAEHAYEKSLYKITELEKKVSQYAETQSLFDEKLNAKEQYTQEIIERSETQKKEILALEGKLAEQKSEIETLEQHLARRVKECALLTSSQEEQETTIKRLETELQKKEELLLSLKHTQEQETALYQEKEKQLSQTLELVHNERDAYIAHVNEQAALIENLKQMEKRYLFLEELFGQAQSALSQRQMLEELDAMHKTPSPQAFAQKAEPTGKILPLTKPFVSPERASEPAKKQDLFTPSVASISSTKAVRHDLFH